MSSEAERNPEVLAAEVLTADDPRTLWSGLSMLTGAVCVAFVAGMILFALQHPVMGVVALGPVALTATVAWVIVPTVPRAVRPVEVGAFDRAAHGRLLTASSVEVKLGNGSALVVKGESPDTRRNRLEPRDQSSDLREAAWAASPSIALGAVELGDTLHDALVLDNSVMNAFTQLSGQTVDGLADFRSVVDANSYQLGSFKLRGTIGEQESARIFEEAGVQVDWPAGGDTAYGPSNMPGYDMTLEGIPVNTKIVQDASEAASDHFAQYPDIPIVVNADAANIPEGALYWDGSEALDPAALMQPYLVVVQEGLALTGVEALADAAQGALDSIGEGLDAVPGLSFIVVGVRSGIQQHRLVADGHTDAARALANVSIDVITKGGGAFVGGKAGALAGGAVDGLAGGALLGVPTAIGMVGGAVAGGYAGSKLGANFKRRHLNRAQKELTEAIAGYGDHLERERQSAERSLSKRRTSEEAAFRKKAAICQQAYMKLLADLGKELQRVAVLDAAKAEKMLADTQSRTSNDLSRTYAQAVVHWIRCLDQTRRFRVWCHQASIALPGSRGEGGEEFLDTLMATDAGVAEVQDHLDRINRQRAAATATASAGYSQLETSLTLLRAAGINALATDEQDQVRRIQDVTQADAARVGECNKAVHREIRALTGAVT